MAIDRNKIAQLAEKLVVAGKIDAAIHEYETLARDNPQDTNTINKIGDLYSRIGKRREAIQQYTKIGDFYAKDGFFLKAIAIFKKINKLDPAHLDTVCRLAGMYARQGLVLEARSQYLIAAQQSMKSGERGRAITAYQALVSLDPDNLAQRLELAHLLSSEGNKSEAAEEFNRVGTEFDRLGKRAEARDAFRNAVQINPGSAALKARLASINVALNDVDAAYDIVREGLIASPGEPSLLSILAEIQERRGEHTQAHRAVEMAVAGSGATPEVLARAVPHYLARGETPRAWETASAAVSAMIQSGKELEALSLLDEFLDHEEDHHDGLARLAEVALLVGAPKRASRAADRLLDLCIDLECREGARHAELLLKLFPEDLVLSEKASLLRGAHLDQTGRLRSMSVPGDNPAPSPDGLTEEVIPGDMSATPTVASSADTGIEDEDFIAEHMTEAEVFVKYGLTDRAVEQLQSVTTRFPGHLPSHVRLKEIHVEEGNREEALSEMVTIIRTLFAQGDRASAEAALAEIRRYDPAGAELSELTTLMATGFAPAPEAVTGDTGILIFDDLDEEGSASTVHDGLVRPDLAGPTDEELAQVDVYLDQVDRDHAVQSLRALADRWGSHPEIVRRMKRAIEMPSMSPDQAARRADVGPAGHQPGGSVGSEEFEIQLDDEREPKPLEVAVAAMAHGDPDSTPESSVGAPVYLHGDGAAFPDDGENFLDDLVSEIDAALSGQPDLSGDIVAGEEAAPEGDSLEEIVAAFKKGVEQQIAADDFGTHYSLGIAYKEMALLDEAIGEFQFAARDEGLLVDCCSMLGLCFKEKGMNALAVKWYRRGIEASAGREDDLVLGLRYDLADLLADSGERSEALNLFIDVFGTNSKYRDVAARIKNLNS